MVTQERRCKNEYCIIPVRLVISDRQEFLNAIRRTGERYGVSIACLNRTMIAGFDHVETALIHAMRAWKEERMIARSLEIEILLYAAGTRQTGQIASFGPETGINSLYLCIVPPKSEVIISLLKGMSEVSDEDWNEVSEEKKKRLMQFYGITPDELEVTGQERLTDLICERCALLAINR
ncbi:MAG TPA: KEOPS complex subunit Cgi121 [Methanospirillum sp.]|uniref:KEOPS complex subunit Cgi121 n=1 Tax=Methanospirillum sp. TaxID=45200 RepID=UPI002B7B6329|nr:KEOPS complex subunit Cgi121 [Methanospirillum sp.]HOJ96781.1 KEOPS complex subunit Cgi121 [Methanospirillum sp.]